uniref:Putative secreted protein n=1 Tax=Panstrongylus lignarius TaxID=156445 RepID=A0A224Y559_9HEMI
MIIPLLNIELITFLRTFSFKILPLKETLKSFSNNEITWIRLKVVPLETAQLVKVWILLMTVQLMMLKN